MTDQTAENMTHRQRMLKDAEEEQNRLTAELQEAKEGRDRLRAEYVRVQAELRSRISSTNARITNLNDQLVDAQRLVKDLTPRTRTRKPAVTEDVPELHAAEDDTAGTSGVID